MRPLKLMVISAFAIAVVFARVEMANAYYEQIDTGQQSESGGKNSQKADGADKAKASASAKAKAQADAKAKADAQLKASAAAKAKAKGWGAGPDPAGKAASNTGNSTNAANESGTVSTGGSVHGGDTTGLTTAITNATNANTQISATIVTATNLLASPNLTAGQIAALTTALNAAQTAETK